MLSFLGKKKLSDNQIANIFVNGIIESVDKGWPVVADFINDSPEFIKSPEVDKADYGKFFMIIVTTNFHFIPENFEDDHGREIIRLCIEKFATIFDQEVDQFANKIKEYKKFLQQVNRPSNKMMSAMSKGVFRKYDLWDFQESFYSQGKTYNPIFIKNLDEIMMNFVWDWESFQTKYKVKDLSGASFFGL